MKHFRVVALALVAVAIAGLVALTPVMPQALAAVGSPAQPQSAAHAPAGRAALQGDLQSTLEQIYENNNDSVVNIQVTMDGSKVLGLNIPGFGGQLPQIPGLPDLGNLFPNLPGSGNQGQQGNNQDQQGNNQGQQGNGSQAAPGGQTPAPAPHALGSGFVWDTDGHIVTNNHVVDGATKITVVFADGTSVPATVVSTDPDSDLAVVKVDPKGLTLKPVTVGDSTTAKPGQFAVAIGNPFGLDGTLTFGIVSAVGRSMPAGEQNGIPGLPGLLGRSNTPSYTIPDIIQIDTPINPGNSGGVLLDLDGKLIGVPTAIESPVGANNGIGFAVPSAIVKNVVPVLVGGGKVVHPYLGISGTTLTPELAQAMNLPATQRGALVSQVSPSGPAEAAKLVASTKQVTIEGQNVNVGGDVITAIDDQPVKRFDDLVTYLARSGQVGKQVTLKVLRDGKETTANVTLAARPAQIAQANTNQAQPSQGNRPRNSRPNEGNNQGQGTNPAPGNNQPQGSTGGAWLGISGMTVTGEVAQAMNVDQNTKGVLVETLAPNSPAVKAGLVASQKDFTTTGGQSIKIGGDIITGVDGNAVTSIEQLASAISGAKPAQKATLSILRDGQDQEVVVTLAARPVLLTN